MEQYNEVLNKEEAQKCIKDGINLATELVAPTLGVKASKVFIDEEYGGFEASDDGITILNKIKVKDPKLQLGVKILKEASSKTNDREGDGTTTTAIIANELVNQVIKDKEELMDFSKHSGMDILKIKNGIKSGFQKVVDFINKNKVDITTDEQLIDVGRISSNSLEVGKMLAEMFKKLGKDASITTADSNSTETKYDIVEGMSFDRGWISYGFVTNPEKEETVIEGENGTNVLVTDYKIQNVEQLETLGNLFKSGVNDLLIIADDVSGIPLETLIFNRLRQTIRVVAVRAPGFGNQVDYLKDIAILVGAKFVSSSESINFKDVTKEHLGKAKKVVVNKEKTTIVGTEGNKEEIETRIKTLKNRLTEIESGYEKEKLNERISKLSGGVGVIKVGGATEPEVKDKKSKINDAVSAVKSALRDGVVAGGGITLLAASMELNDDIEGESILKKSIQKPFEQIALNSYLAADKMKNEVMSNKEIGYGYDVENNKWGNMFEMGIIDPAGVVKTALENAISIAVEVLECSGAITLVREEKSKEDNKQLE